MWTLRALLLCNEREIRVVLGYRVGCYDLVDRSACKVGGFWVLVCGGQEVFSQLDEGHGARTAWAGRSVAGSAALLENPSTTYLISPMSFTVP